MLMGLAKAGLESSVCFMLQVGGACLETGDSVSIISKDIGDWDPGWRSRSQHLGYVLMADCQHTREQPSFHTAYLLKQVKCVNRGQGIDITHCSPGKTLTRVCTFNSFTMNYWIGPQFRPSHWLFALITATSLDLPQSFRLFILVLNECVCVYIYICHITCSHLIFNI